MSFRLFVYYCAAWGAAAALFGWILGQFLAADSASPLLREALKGMALGLFLAVGLGLVDALGAGSQRDTTTLGVRLTLALLVGTAGGLLGGFLGQAFYQLLGGKVLRIFGWTLMGLLIGAAPCLFDFLGAVLRNEDRQGARRKLRNGLIGGAVGGVIGGSLTLMLRGLLEGVFKDSEADSLWSPGVTGFVALGACIGLAVSLAQVILREAWLRVEAGFRPGRQLLLTRPETTIGRAESCDVGLFGDATVEKVHAKITRQGNQWLVTDAGTPSGTLVNGQRLTGAVLLRPGDRIQVGGSVLSFDMRTKEPAAAPVAVPA